MELKGKILEIIENFGGIENVKTELEKIKLSLTEEEDIWLINTLVDFYYYLYGFDMSVECDIKKPSSMYKEFSQGILRITENTPLEELYKDIFNTTDGYLDKVRVLGSF